jgi:methionyl-tRNA synthetase
LKKEKILVTAALPYANGRIHLGHLAGAYLPADIFVRYHRLNESDIIFVGGSDEHGVAITIAADKAGVTPKDIIDKYHNDNKTAFEKFGMSFDLYSRTSLPLHHETSKEFFLEFYKRGILNTKTSLQFYDDKAGMFLPDRYVEGTCPRCGNEAARSDECENCGSLYEPSELKNPISKVSGTTPVLKETTHWYFPLGEYQERLKEYVKTQDEKYGWKDNVLQYCKGWFHDGLTDRAITRDLDWGVPVPIDEAKGKVLYVWFDAVLGYISATKELSEKLGEPDLWKKYWQDPETRYIPFIGKDNVVFHCIVFPAMLMAWNDGKKAQYTLPENVPANEFLNFEGKKFSKSRNWGIDVLDFLDKFNADALRYALAFNLPELRDADFYWKEFQARYNNELADILGNFINRTMTFVFKNFGGKVPPLYELSERDNELLNLLESYPEKVGSLYNRYKVKDGLAETMNLARAANKYFNDSEPWKAIKTDKEQCSTTLNICLQTIFTLAELFSPVIPFTSEKIFAMLGAKPVAWKNAGKYNLQEGQALNQPEILFRKIEDEVIDDLINGLPKDETEWPKAEQELITIDDFKKVAIVVGEIVEAEAVQKSDKLLKLQVSDGSKKRQIIAGIAKHYKPADLKGKKVLFAGNLKPAKLMGLDSEGMILALESNDGKLKVIEVPSDIKTGSKAR